MEQEKNQLKMLVPVVVVCVIGFVGWTWYSFFYTPGEDTENVSNSVVGNSFEKNFRADVPKAKFSDLEENRGDEVEAELRREDSIKYVQEARTETFRKRKDQKLKLVLDSGSMGKNKRGRVTDLSQVSSRSEQKQSGVSDIFSRPGSTATKTPKEKQTVYVDRNLVSKSEVVKQEIVPQERVRRKSAFSSSAIEQGSASSGVVTSLPVVIQDDAALVDGGGVFMRTTREVKVEGCTIPLNTLIKGVVSGSGSSMFIDVGLISAGDCLVNKNWSAYSLDGTKGLAIIGGVSNRNKREGVNELISAAQQVVNIPVVRNLPFNASQRAVNDQTVKVSKGHSLILKINE